MQTITIALIQVGDLSYNYMACRFYRCTQF